MKKMNWIAGMSICLWMVSGSCLAYAADEGGKKPLDEAFDRTVIIPFNYKNKAFIDGQLTDLFYKYQPTQRSGRVLVPIRMMGDLVSTGNGHSSTWDTIWQPQHPNDVILSNANLHRTVKFTIDSKTMTVNNKLQTMDVAPQKINGQIMLPLRSAAEALDKKIDWLDGLILIGDESVDLQSPRTLAVKDEIAVRLTDPRQLVNYDQPLYPLSKVGGFAYYYKSTFTANGQSDELYRKADGQKAVWVKLRGNPMFANSGIIGGELYFVTIVNGQAELGVIHFADNRSEKVASLTEWRQGDGWLTDIRIMNNELYVILHFGDGIIGSETLYKVERGVLKPVAKAKSFINYAIGGDDLYYTDFEVIGGGADNLFRVDMKTGEAETVGEKGFAYGINRTFDGQILGYGSNRSLYMRDGYLYALGYKESDPEGNSAVYKINPADGTQVKLTATANDFWLIGNHLYYIDADTGYLIKADLDGGNRQVLVEHDLMHLQLFNDNFYYIAGDNADTASAAIGQLYRYDTASGREVKLSDISISSFYIAKTGIYYLSDGYGSGLYRIGADGSIVQLVDDTIGAAVATDEGIVYTLRYKDGIFSVK